MPILEVNRLARVPIYRAGERGSQQLIRLFTESFLPGMERVARMVADARSLPLGIGFKINAVFLRFGS